MKTEQVPALRRLSLPVAQAVLLHGALAVILLVGFSFTQPEPDSFELPPSMQASLMVEPKPEPKSQPKPEPKPEPEPEPQPEPEPKPEPEPEPEPQPEPEPEPEPQPEPEPEPTPEPKPEPKPEPQPEPQPKTEPQPEPEPQQAEPQQPQFNEDSALDDLMASLDSEDEQIAQQQQQLEQQRAAEAEMARTTEAYSVRIEQQATQAWTRPMEVRALDLTGRETVVRITLLPTGELREPPEVVTSSGLPTLDQSALRAVQRVRRFDVPDDIDVFNRSFRSFTITFRPEDLMK